jgi:hypothetical protein
MWVAPFLGRLFCCKPQLSLRGIKAFGDMASSSAEGPDGLTWRNGRVSQPVFGADTATGLRYLGRPRLRIRRVVDVSLRNGGLSQSLSGSAPPRRLVDRRSPNPFHRFRGSRGWVCRDGVVSGCGVVGGR